MYMSCTCTLVPQIFLVVKSSRGVFRVIMMDGSGDKLDNVPICRLRAGGCTTYMYVYMYMCCVCVTIGKRTLPSCSRASPCGQERGREIMRDGVIYG